MISLASKLPLIVVLSLYFAVPYDGKSRCLLDVTSLYGSPHQEDSDTKASRGILRGGGYLQGKASCRPLSCRQSEASSWSCPSSCRPKSSTSTCSSRGEKGEKVCQVCKRSSSRLRVHMRSHSKTGPKCAKCGKQFTTKAGLRSHLELCGSAETHICPVCGKRFKSDKSLQAHNADHLAPAGGLPCQYCGSNFKNSRILKDHESRDCAKGPSYAGPFYHLVANCPRVQGHGDPFRWVKDCNAHM